MFTEEGGGRKPPRTVTIAVGNREGGRLHVEISLPRTSLPARRWAPTNCTVICYLL